MLTATPPTLAASEETGSIGICHLKRFWAKHDLIKQGLIDRKEQHKEWKIDTTLLAILGLGLEQTLKHLYKEDQSFESFEQWILEVNQHQLDQEKIDTFNHYIYSKENNKEPLDKSQFILTEEDINHWNEHGYVIIKNAISKEDCELTIQAICGFININRNDPATWYTPNPNRQGIMVQLFQHDQLQKNRLSPKIKAAYEQLWQRKDLWVNTDRVGFNPPQTESWHFPGPLLHWDVSLATPIPFGLQGILYLADTEHNQGAFTLVPGFHNRVEAWLNSLPANAHPREQDLYALGTKPVVANAGDFIIWHHALPHGSSVNTSDKPRFVQYINYEPLDREIRDEWI